MSFHVKSFLTLLFTIGNIAVWGAMAPRPSGSVPGSWIKERGQKYQQKLKIQALDSTFKNSEVKETRALQL